MLIRLFRYLDKVMAAVLTALLWYLQKFEGDKNFSCPDYLAKYKFEIAYFGLFVTLLTALITSLYEELTKRRTIDSWAKNFMSHIIEQHLCGGDSKTRITIFKPQKGYKLILPYIFCYPIKAFFMTDYKINGQAFWSNILKEVFKDKGQLYDTDLHGLPLIIAGNPKTLRFKRNVTDGLGLVKSVLEIEQ